MSPPRGEIGLGHAVDEACGGSSLTKRTASLREMKLRRCGPRGQQVQQIAAFALAVLLEFFAQHLLCARLVAVGIEHRIRRRAAGDRPSSR